jgi:hypothetical protein
MGAWRSVSGPTVLSKALSGSAVAGAVEIADAFSGTLPEFRRRVEGLNAQNMLLREMGLKMETRRSIKGVRFWIEHGWERREASQTVTLGDWILL